MTSAVQHGLPSSQIFPLHDAVDEPVLSHSRQSLKPPHCIDVDFISRIIDHHVLEPVHEVSPGIVDVVQASSPARPLASWRPYFLTGWFLIPPLSGDTCVRHDPLHVQLNRMRQDNGHAVSLNEQ